MKQNRCLKMLVVLIFVQMLIFRSLSAAGGITPSINNGDRWRIGFYEGGPWPDYQATLMETVKSLVDLGWIEKIELPAHLCTDDTKTLWNWLSRNIRSNYIDFVQDAYWSANWEDELRVKNKVQCLERLRGKEMDLILACGTWAGLDLANNSHSVPTIVMSTSDPIATGIIKSAQDSGFEHVMAECDPTRYRRQIQLFYDIIRFKRLGVIYEDTPDGRGYSNLEDLRYVAKHRGFELVECVAPDTNLTEAAVVQAYADCCERLAPTIDAFYFSAHRGAAPENMVNALVPLLKHKVRTWSNWGLIHVRNGVLLSVGRKNFKFSGIFYAKSLAKILNGAKPRNLNQVLKEEISLSVNLETARIIGYLPPKNLMKITEVVFHKIGSP